MDANRSNEQNYEDEGMLLDEEVYDYVPDEEIPEEITEEIPEEAGSKEQVQGIDVNEITNTDYIKLIYENHEKMYADLKEEERMESWYRLRSQVNSALALGLSKKQIDIFAREKYGYEQQEVLKYIIYAGCSKDIVLKIANPKYTAAEMIVMYESSQREKALLDAVKEPIDTISESVAGFKLEYEMYKERVNLQIREKDSKINELSQVNESLAKKLEDIKQTELKKEKAKSYDAKLQEAAEDMANKRYQAMIIEQMAKQRERQEIEAEVRRQYEGRNCSRRKKKIFGRSNKSITHDPATAFSASFHRTGSSENNITDMILRSELSSEQMQVITLAVKCNIENEIIEEMIRKNMPAENMKQIVEVTLVRREKERRKEAEQASALSNMKNVAENRTASSEEHNFMSSDNETMEGYEEALYYGE